MNEAKEKLEKLRALLKNYGSCVVAYSGGVDSVFLATVAGGVLGDRMLAAIADSPSLPRRELQEALEIAAIFKFPVCVIKTQELANRDYTANPVNRCYFCKHELFEHLKPLAKAKNIAVIAYGENASDASDVRPGTRAAAEFEVRAPLKEVGLTKLEIRELSRQLGLPTAEKPQMACLSSRIPYGEPVSPEKLSMIEQAEYILRDLGFRDIRVRHHEMGKKSLARIELAPPEIPALMANDTMALIARELMKIGYAHVTLDLQGYRRGSLNETPGPNEGHPSLPGS